MCAGDGGGAGAIRLQVDRVALDTSRTVEGLDTLPQRAACELVAHVREDGSVRFPRVGRVEAEREFREGTANGADEAELAGVLGHEIGHVTARHGNRRMSRAMLMQGGLVAGAIVIGAADEDSVLRRYGQYGLPVAQVGGQLVVLRYGRDAEYQADELGMRYMSRAGYKPSGQRGVMMTLARLSEGGQRPPVWLSTHPFPDDRVARIDNLLNSTFREAEASSGASSTFV